MDDGLKYGNLQSLSARLASEVVFDAELIQVPSGGTTMVLDKKFNKDDMV